MRDDEIPLHGNVGGAVLRGDEVLRTAGPWTPAVHALLRHVAAAGLQGIPRVLGVEGATGERPQREVLSYLPGRSIAPDDELATDDVLAGAAAWLRAFHDAVASFRPAERLIWRQQPDGVVLGDDQLVCHNDPGSYNWIVDEGRFVGMIDWDMAGPGRAIDDLGFLCWSGVPLYRPIPEADAARRLRLVADAYGGADGAVDPADLLDAAEARMRTASERIAAGQRRGDPGLVNLAKIGEPQRTLDRLADFAERRPAIEAALG